MMITETHSWLADSEEGLQGGDREKEGELAQDNPMLVMVDEQTGDKYARMTGAKGIGENQERDWLIKDISRELVSWGHAEGVEGNLIIKTDV